MPTTAITEITASIDTISARTDGAGSPVTPDWKAEERRMALTFLTPGILTPQNGWIATKGNPGTMTVVIGSGTAETDIVVVPGLVAGQGTYLVRLDEAGKTLSIDAADPSNSRIDQIFAVVYDNSYDASGVSLPRLVVRTGDAASSPVAPGPAASWEAYQLLATITVPANAPDIDACTLVDERDFSNVNTAGGGGVPVGATMPYPYSIAPDGYLLAQGQAVSRASFPRLHSLAAADGYPHGSGDGSTTFNLPDLRQRFVLGKAASGTGSVLGQTGGAIDHFHTQPTHTHNNSSTGAAGSHSHTQGSTGSGGSHTHDFTVLTGGPTIVISVTEGTAGPTWNLADNTHQHSDSGTTDSIGSHTHTNPTTSTASSHTHSVDDTDPAGGENTSTNNPPYIVMNWIIKT